MTRATLALLFAAACTGPKLPDFVMPRSVEDVRGRLLPLIEGHPAGEAREFLASHGFQCDEPLPSATEARVQLCHPVSPKRAWTAEIYERNGRIADVQAR